MAPVLLSLIAYLNLRSLKSSTKCADKSNELGTRTALRSLICEQYHPLIFQQHVELIVTRNQPANRLNYRVRSLYHFHHGTYANESVSYRYNFLQRCAALDAETRTSHKRVSTSDAAGSSTNMKRVCEDNDNNPRHQVTPTDSYARPGPSSTRTVDPRNRPSVVAQGESVSNSKSAVTTFAGAMVPFRASVGLSVSREQFPADAFKEDRTSSTSTRLLPLGGHSPANHDLVTRLRDAYKRIRDATEEVADLRAQHADRERQATSASLLVVYYARR